MAIAAGTMQTGLERATMQRNSVPTDTITFDGPIVLPADVGSPQQSPPTPPPQIARVLHVINGEHYSGAERVQDLLGLRLPELGYAVGFACAKRGRFAAERQATACDVHDVTMASRWSLAAARELERVVVDHQYDLLHAHTPRTLMLASRVARRTGRPLIYHAHSPTRRDSTRRLQNRINAWVESRSLRSVSHTIAVSSSLARCIEECGADANKVTVVHNGVPVPKLRRSSEPPVGSWQLGTLALFRPRKGVEVLLEALAELRSRGHNATLRAVGPFETEVYEKSLKQRARTLGLADHVVWSGFSSDPSRELQRMDLLVLPSLFGEGLPMVVLEAMGSGVPVIGTRVEGVPEAVLDRITGLLVRPGDATELANAVEEIIHGTLKWSALQEAARARHAEFFTDSHMAQMVANVYQNVLR